MNIYPHLSREEGDKLNNNKTTTPRSRRRRRRSNTKYFPLPEQPDIQSRKIRISSKSNLGRQSLSSRQHEAGSQRERETQRVVVWRSISVEDILNTPPPGVFWKVRREQKNHLLIPELLLLRWFLPAAAAVASP